MFVAFFISIFFMVWGLYGKDERVIRGGIIILLMSIISMFFCWNKRKEWLHW
jgi:hypothetical protein